MSALNRILRLTPALAALACAPGPIAWEDPKEVSWEPFGAVPLFDSASRPPAGRAGFPAPSLPNQCANTVNLWVGHGFTHAAWWAVRPDGGADIVATSTTPDDFIWRPPVRLDTLDISKVGCNRPPPAIFGDGKGNVHVVYGMRAPEGPGLFLSHSMDGGRSFHSPVPIVYGEKLGLASVMSDSLLVIVAYEDPNTTPTRISIAFSKTMGHLFEYREVVSPEDVAASEPLVVITGKDVTLRWRRAGSDSTKAIERRGTVR